MGYRVDAVDWAASALAIATDSSPETISFHQADVSHGDLNSLAPEGGYQVITMRRALAHLPDRTRVVAELAALLAPDGILCVITPHADRTRVDLRTICLDEAEIALLTDGWEHTDRAEAGGCTVLLLRGPRASVVAYEEKGTPKAAAMAGVAVVVTNGFGQVLLGWNAARNMWELPAGKVEPGEAFEATAVRELEEEAGLVAAPESVLLLGTLCDTIPGGLTRVTEIARITAFTGEPVVREPEQVTRWEWHTPSDLRRLPQPLFTASAQAINTAWPGLLPDVPEAHHTPRPAGTVRLDFAEPPAATRLRQALARELTEAGWADTRALQNAFATVPRHAFLPEQQLARAYANDAVPTVTDPVTGRSTSAVSQPEIQALMLGLAELRRGDEVLEIGGGGYNAALAAEVVGPSVVCVEIDPYVHARTTRFLTETGYADRVRTVLGDGTLGAPAALVPHSGFDAIIVTVAAADFPRAWTGQLAEGGRLVLPLRIGGFTRTVGLRSENDRLYSTGISVSSFVPMQGAGRWDETAVPIGDSGYGIRWEDTPPASLDGLDTALGEGGVELATGVLVRPDESFEDLQLRLATGLPGFCRLTGDRDQPGPIRLPKFTDAMAMVADRSLACVVLDRHEPGPDADAPVWEFGVQAFGPNAKAVADHLAEAIRAWDRELRGRAAPALTVLAAGTPDSALPVGDVVDKPNARIVVTWPQRDTAGGGAVGQVEGSEVR